MREYSCDEVNAGAFLHTVSSKFHMTSESGSCCKFINYIFGKVIKVAVCLGKTVEGDIGRLVR